MQRRLPPLNWLRAFEAAARHLSFTHAAEELGLTQAAISKQVKSLELHLKEQLFERKPRSLVLTQAGNAYLPKVREAFDRLAAGTVEVFGRRSGELLTIRVSVGFSTYWLASRLHRFYQRHPDIPLRIVSSVWSEDWEDHVDFEVKYGTGRWSGYNVHLLCKESLFPVCSPKLLEGPNAIRDPEDLVNHSLLHVIGYEEGWANWLTAAGYSKLEVGRGQQYDTSVLVFEVAASGYGVALGRRSMAHPLIESGRLVKPFDIDIDGNEAFYLLETQDRAPHAHAEAFRDWILEEVSASDWSLTTKP
ncbi:transcriptional regulator GcvA [Curvivirga aplysinae]|uniref:transcriptional regulator GcvA n=1 Tax=Curvivirga aplysinae TaxID=2529852 RepID=UPI0012BD3B6A|nr:transcriptional regulator GcvA [Curvivirga aplysinae]MTI09291.1 transcriptional regulator GcvA [Curvivirga aplysinae]